jgi:hypothetical protein
LTVKATILRHTIRLAEADKTPLPRNRYQKNLAAPIRPNAKPQHNCRQFSNIRRMLSISAEI